MTVYTGGVLDFDSDSQPTLQFEDFDIHFKLEGRYVSYLIRPNKRSSLWARIKFVFTGKL